MASKFVDESSPNFRFSDVAQEPLRMLPPISDYEHLPLVSLEEAVEPVEFVLPQVKQMVSTVKKKCNQPRDNLSADESASIMLYSLEWMPREHSFYFILNTILRSENRNELEPWLLYLRLIASALSKLPSTTGKILYRGVTIVLSAQYSKERRIVWWGFSSCTTSIKMFDDEQSINSTKVRTLFIIKCHSGKAIGRHSYNSTEDEVLLFTARRFKVVSCRTSINGLHLILLEEIQFPSMTESGTISVKTNNFNYCKMTLNQRIDKYTRYSEVNLRGQHLLDKDMELVVKKAVIEKQCTWLSLQNNKITWQGALIIASALYDNETLETLYLSQNRVCDGGILFLATKLSNNYSTLTMLTLDQNRITNIGAQYLADMLKTNGTLTDLWLSYNDIGDSGVEYLANALAYSNKSLQQLYLNENKLVTDSSVDSLINMLQFNRSLNTFWVQNCNLSKNGKERLLNEVTSKKNFDLDV